MHFFAELKRRKVVRAGIAYVVIAWVVAQVAGFAVEIFGAPDWVMKIVVVFLVLGLPFALFFAWAFELTPDGLKRDKDLDREEQAPPINGVRTDRIVMFIMIAVLALVLAAQIYQKASVVDADTGDAGVGQQSIAVLPFVNLSDDNDNFADGLSEELLNLLAKTPGLKVAARTSSFAFKGRNEDLREIGDALGVEHVLEGSVRRSGDRLRITAQLIKVADGFHAWSETYDREMADIFEIQDDVASAIAGTLQLRLAPESTRVTTNADAYALYVEALSMLPLEDGDAFRGIRLLDRAIALDTGFAKAFELKALLYYDTSAWTISGAETQLIIHDLCTRALALDDSLIIARLLRTFSDPVSWDWTREIGVIDEAMQTEPDNLNLIAIAAYDLITAGYFSEALALARRHVELDPLSTRGWEQLGEAYAALGQHELARQSWEKLTELGSPHFSSIHVLAGLLTAGELESAVTFFETNAAQLGFERDQVKPFVTSALDAETGLEYLRGWVDAKIADAGNYEEQYAPYYWYLYFGYLDEYWRVIESRVRQSPSMWDDTGSLEHRGRVYSASGFAAHPAYLPHVERSKLTVLWETRGKPDTCSKDTGVWVCE